MNNPELNQQLVHLVCSAVKQASKAILDVYYSDEFDAELKGDHSPLTRADRVSHQIISEVLESTHWPLLSEEGSVVDYHVRKNWPLFWLVDPLDGTKEFLKRNDEYTVNVALISKGVPIFGVISIPVQGTIYYGPIAGQVYRENQDGTVSTLNPKPSIDYSKEGIRVVASRSHLDDQTQAFISRLKNPILVSKGSSLKFLMLADEQADVYPRFAPTMEWDTAAADAIIRALNIEIIQSSNRQELMYNKQDLTNPSFICQAKGSL